MHRLSNENAQPGDGHETHILIADRDVLNELYRLVIIGNLGEDSLVSRVKAVEGDLLELQELLKGDGSKDNPGLDKKVDRLDSIFRFIAWEIGIGVVLLGVVEAWVHH